MPLRPYTDPTSGQVKYFSRVNAQENGPAYVQHDGKAVLRADRWTNHSLGAPRNLCVILTEFILLFHVQCQESIHLSHWRESNVQYPKSSAYSRRPSSFYDHRTEKGQ